MSLGTWILGLILFVAGYLLGKEIEQVKSKKYIKIEKGRFERILDCLKKQKYIYSQDVVIQEEWKGVIDRVWEDGMDLLNKHKI